MIMDRSDYGIHLDMMGRLINDDNLSLDTWQDMINTIPGSFDASFDVAYRLNRLLLEYDNKTNKKQVIIEIVEWMLSAYPGLASLYDDGILPIHVACFNPHCPSAVVTMLAKDYPKALEEMCLVSDGDADGITCHTYQGQQYFEGLPLSYYLARTSNVDIDAVKMLVQTFPQALLKAEAYDNEVGCATALKYYPIHAIAGNPQIRDLKDILDYLLECEPSSIRMQDDYKRTPLNIACSNKNVNLEVVQLLLNSWPEGAKQADDFDDDGECLPIHNLCKNYHLDDTTSIGTLQLLLEADLSSSKKTCTGDQCLPIHYAVGYGHKSMKFCKLLVEAYPESIRIKSGAGSLPIHEACMYNRAEIVDYLLQTDPKSINIRDNGFNYRGGGGCLPIHLAEDGETIRVLLKHDPDAASRTNTDGRLLLHLICGKNSISLSVVEALFDAYPEAIGCLDQEGKTPVDLARDDTIYLTQTYSVPRRNHNVSVVNFFEKQLVIARQAKDIQQMTTPDENGYLPLHRALLQGDASLGSIKLITRGNLSAMQVAVGQNRLLPIHIACRNSTAGIVQFLMEEAPNTMHVCDANKDYPLHYACRAANLNVIRYLVGRTSLVSERNAANKLPFHLLLEFEDDQVNRESPEFTEACWQLLRAYPETVMVQTITSRKRKRYDMCIIS